MLRLHQPPSVGHLFLSRMDPVGAQGKRVLRDGNPSTGSSSPTTQQQIPSHRHQSPSHWHSHPTVIGTYSRFQALEEAGAFCLWASGVQEKCVWEKFSTFTEGSRTLPERRKTGVLPKARTPWRGKRGGAGGSFQVPPRPGLLDTWHRVLRPKVALEQASQPASQREAQNSPPRGCPASKDRGSPAQASSL